MVFFSLLSLISWAGIISCQQKGQSQKQKSKSQSKTEGSESAIAFMSDRLGHSEIYTMRPNGSEQKRLTISPVAAIKPAWSLDGTKLAFLSAREKGDKTVCIMLANLITGVTYRLKNSLENLQVQSLSWSPKGDRLLFEAGEDLGWRDIYVINENGTGLQKLIENASAPSWSPDGRKIVFEREDGIYVINPDKTRLKRISYGFHPSWSPDGDFVTFTNVKYDKNIGDNNIDVWIVKIDQTERIRLTTHPAQDITPTWSADGSKIAFASDRNGHWQIYTMNINGSEQINVSNHYRMDLQPSWSKSSVPSEYLDPLYVPRVTSVVDKSEQNNRKTELSALKARSVADHQAEDWNQEAKLVRVVAFPMAVAVRPVDGTLYDLIGTALYTYAQNSTQLIIAINHTGSAENPWGETPADSEEVPVLNWRLDIAEAMFIAEDNGAIYWERQGAAPHILEMKKIEGKWKPVWRLSSYFTGRGDSVLVDADSGGVYRITKTGEINPIFAPR